MTDVAGRLTAALSRSYRIQRELGRGGVAPVYLAHDLRHKRAVAIKVLRPELAAALGPERFLREIETTANLRHPGILPLYDSGEADDFLYYVMPFVEGETLRDRLACVLVEMLTGEAPFAAATPQRTIARRLTEPPPVLVASRPEAGPQLSGVMERVLATDPAVRHATAAEFANALAVPWRSDPAQTA